MLSTNDNGDGYNALLISEQSEDALVGADSVLASKVDEEETTFVWNARRCTGTMIHLLALRGKLNEIRELVQGYSDTRKILHTRFRYETVNPFTGNRQEGSGEPIHLAASRGHVEVVKYLLIERADLKKTVSRDRKPHYDVLHAAMFAEGRGGKLEMIKFLFEAKADMSQNLDGRFPLHIAFLTGNVPVITLLREYLAAVQATHSFKPGEMGIVCDDTGIVLKVSDDGPACTKGLTFGDRIIKVGTEPYSKDALDRAEKSGNGYEVTVSAASTDEAYVNPKVPMPLSLGITEGKMDEVKLSDAAELSTLSLRTFINEAPQCIRRFLVRFQGATHISATDLAKNLTRFDIANLLLTDPDAAIALLDAATDVPECSNRAWHPLPARVSFAPRSAANRIRRWFNPQPFFFTFYEKEAVWSFDSGTFRAPNWHATITDRSLGRPILDAEVRVCHIPDLICAEVFGALCHSEHNCLNLYTDHVVFALIKHVFWNGCVKVDLMRWLLNLVGLALLIIDEAYTNLLFCDRVPDELHTATHHPDNDGTHLKSACGEVSFSRDPDMRHVWVAFTWIACKAFIDLVLEFVQFRGYYAIGRASAYMSVSNLADFLGNVLPAGLWFLPTWKVQLLVITIIVLWGKLLSCVTFAEHIGTEILPIVRLILSLWPALVVTLIAFGAFTHAFYVVDGSDDVLYPDVFLESFATLLTAATPHDGSYVTGTKLFLIFFAVLFFAVFILNIFIAVIGEQYAKEKKTVRDFFQVVRAKSCFDYLLQCRSIPCRLISSSMANAIIYGTWILIFAVHIYCFFQYEYRHWVPIVVIGCQALCVLCSFQNPDADWLINVQDAKSPSYVWFCKRVDIREPHATTKEVQELRATASNMKSQLEDMISVLAERSAKRKGH